MKKRKRAQAEPRRDRSSPDAPAAPEAEEKASPAPTKDAETAATSPSDAPGETVASEAAPADDAPAQSADAAQEGLSADAAGPADEPAAVAASPEPGGAAGSASLAGDGEAVSAGGDSPSPEDDDSGWEDAPTRELDVGNMEFAATWTDAHDTLPNVDPEADAAEASSDGDGDGTPDGEGAEDGEALPTDMWRVESILESLLFATDRPLGVSDLKRLLAVKDAKIVTDALGALRDRRSDSGIQLISVAGGWQLRTHPANGAWVAKLVAGRPQRLSRAMMETLAIVAYRQPITRPEIDEIRGVDCGPVLRTLLDRNLIRIIGKKEEVGRPMLYGTTPEFLKTFSLRDLTELPTLREFHELGADEKAQVDKKLPRPEGEVGSDAVGAAGEAPLRPATVDLPQADPAEDDELFDELDRATAAAARASDAAAPPPEPTAEDEPASASSVGEG